MLHGTIYVNHLTIGYWSARREKKITDPDAVYSYEVIVWDGPDNIMEGHLEHKYSDGARVLAAKVLLWADERVKESGTA